MEIIGLSQILGKIWPLSFLCILPDFRQWFLSVYAHEICEMITQEFVIIEPDELALLFVCIIQRSLIYRGG